MTQHNMTNGNQVNGTTSSVETTDAQVSTVVAGPVLCTESRHREDVCGLDVPHEAYREPGKRLPKPTQMPKRLIPFLASQACLQKQAQLRKSSGGVSRDAGELPAAAWASFALSRTISYGSVSL